MKRAKVLQGVKAITNTCQPCTVNFSMRGFAILAFKRTYLKNCPKHLKQWDDADAAYRSREARRAEVQP